MFGRRFSHFRFLNCGLILILMYNLFLYTYSMTLYGIKYISPNYTIFPENNPFSHIFLINIHTYFPFLILFVKLEYFLYFTIFFIVLSLCFSIFLPQIVTLSLFHLNFSYMATDGDDFLLLIYIFEYFMPRGLRCLFLEFHSIKIPL